jgi:hypothetical protein
MVMDWEVLRALGFDEMGCLEIAHIVGIFNYLTRLADGFGLELHPALMEAARGIELFCDNLRAYLDGRPLINVIDWSIGY